ncbi:hypothetical protein NTGBS_970003 [Candidatus Nitrotoga sp. BS]|nr:hypothetical protein NTGBS_970003 [Candidatus Nitrotoga sp. BS]
MLRWCTGYVAPRISGESFSITSKNIHVITQLPPTKVGGLRLRPPPTKSGQTVADSAKTIFTERMMKLIVFKILNAPAKAGGFNQLIENKIDKDTWNNLIGEKYETKNFDPVSGTLLDG